MSQPAARNISTSLPFNIYFKKIILLFIFTRSEWRCKWHRNTFKGALVHKTFYFCCWIEGLKKSTKIFNDYPLNTSDQQDTDAAGYRKRLAVSMRSFWQGSLFLQWFSAEVFLRNKGKKLKNHGKYSVVSFIQSAKYIHFYRKPILCLRYLFLWKSYAGSISFKKALFLNR